MKINTEMTLSIPIDGIAKAEIVKVSVGKTALLIGASVVTLVVTVILISSIYSLRHWHIW